MATCVFCRILSGELESSFAYRGSKASAFLDIHPITPGHVLIVPHSHVERFAAIEPSTTAEMIEIAQKILREIQRTDLKCEGTNIFLSDGAVAGQDVPHSHLHIVPRFYGDGHKMGFSHTDPEQINRATLNVIAGKISQMLK